MKTDLLIVGAGASGLMAAVAAAEAGLRTVLVERKHRPGRKILLCGNNRCNLSSDLTVDAMIKAYGEPVGEFLRPAITLFPPEALKMWFKAGGLPVSVHKDGRIFPKSERADDVLHVFTDLLRDRSVPVIYNSPVTGVRKYESGYIVESASLDLQCANVLISTGGVSYPKTGSVGDGQKIARALGHKVLPYRPGLVGFVMKDRWLHDFDGCSFTETRVDIIVKGRIIDSICGEILCNTWGLGGPAMVNASRIIARQDIRDYEFVVDLQPGLSESKVAALLVERLNRQGGSMNLTELLANAFIPKEICSSFVTKVLGLQVGAMIKASEKNVLDNVAAGVKGWRLVPESTRPLKEAMVTVGGVDLESVDPATMQSRRSSGLYFAGEVLDVDGPTGGFNLHAAFATARLAVSSICSTQADLTPVSFVGKKGRSRRGKGRYKRR